jgi:hypothetical protein
MDYTDNVVEFMAQDLGNLPKEVPTRCVNAYTLLIYEKISSLGLPT